MEQQGVFKEYEKFIKEDVIVRYSEGVNIREIRGQLRFLNFNYLSCVLMTDTEKILIKNVITISRKRNTPK